MEAEVRRWILDVNVEAKELENQLAPLLERQRALEERLGILKRLLATLANDAPRGGGEVVPNGHPDTDGFASVRDRVIRHGVEILQEADGPLHINDIHAEFVKRGYEIPGAGKPVNITVHLSSAESVVSPNRGYYALRPRRAAREPVRDESRSTTRG